jgi:hypothetical protein
MHRGDAYHRRRALGAAPAGNLDRPWPQSPHACSSLYSQRTPGLPSAGWPLLLRSGAQALQLAFGVYACLRRGIALERRFNSLVVSGLGSLLPLVTLLLFLVVFVIGGSSNVAQVAGGSGYDLWSLWCSTWPLLFLGNPLAFIVVLVAASLPPYSLSQWPSFCSRWCAVAAAGFACYTVVKFFPDA